MRDLIGRLEGLQAAGQVDEAAASSGLVAFAKNRMDTVEKFSEKLSGSLLKKIAADDPAVADARSEAVEALRDLALALGAWIAEQD